ncbi:MAG TPA: efflux RND transporter periplasmic adaptor subunit [Rhodocyclaceae bacterium]
MTNTPIRRLALASLLPLALAACGDQKPAGPGGPGAGMPPPEVEVVSIAPGSAVLTQDLPGRLSAVRTAQVRARVEGIVEKRLFAEGSDVKAGAPLFQLDARTYKTAAASAEADVEVAKLTVERYKPLLALKAVSQQEFDQAAAKLKQAEAALAKAKLDLENASVPSPIAGRVGRAMVTEGALVGRGDATLLATVEQLDPIYVDFTQSNAEVLRLQQAIKDGKLKRAAKTHVDLLLEDGSVYPLPGKLIFSDLAVDPNTGSIQLRAEFPNPKRELLPGTFVRIRVSQAEMDGAIKVPQRAVQTTPQGQMVTIVTPDGKAAPQPVKTGAMSGPDWIITDGLKGGEQVIVNGLQKARPGSPVKAVPWNASPVPAPMPAAAPAAPAAPPAATPAGAPAAPAAAPAKTADAAPAGSAVAQK